MRLTHAVIHTIENGVIEDGYVELLSNKLGKIGAMADSAPMADDEDLHGAHILPGFIDAHTCLGLKEDSMRYEGNDWNETGKPLNPQLRACDGFSTDDRAIRYALEGAVTTVGVAPGNLSLIGGQVAAMKLCAAAPQEMRLRACCALKIAMGEAPKNKKCGPVTRMAEGAMLRNELSNARYALEHGQSNAALEPLIALLKGEIPAFIHAQRADDIVNAVMLSREYGFRCVIVHGADSAMVGDFLAQMDVPVIVGSLIQEPADYETRSMDLDLPRKLHEKGVRFAITTDHHMSPIQMLSISAALSVREGLDEDTALRAVTLEPAKLLGIEDRVGSIVSGKDADLAVFSGHPFRAASRLQRLLINGEDVL